MLKNYLYIFKTWIYKKKIKMFNYERLINPDIEKNKSLKFYHLKRFDINQHDFLNFQPQGSIFKTKKIIYKKHFLHIFKKKNMKNLQKSLENKDIYFIVLKIKNKLTPELYLSKNFEKIKSFSEQKFRLFKEWKSQPHKVFHFFLLRLKMDYFFNINKRFIFYFFHKFFKKYYLKNFNFIYVKINKEKKYIRFIKKHPKLKKKYRKKNQKNVLFKI